jgi:folate-binding protein YgfZ
MKYLIAESRGLFTMTGPDAVTLLQGLVSNDVEQVSPDRSAYAALLTAQGRFLHDFIVSAWDGGLVIDCERARQDDLMRRLTLYRLRSKVQFASLNDSHAVVLLWDGPVEAPGCAGPFGGGVACTDPRHAGLGRRAILPRGALASELRAAGFSEGSAGDYERLRLTLGVPDGSRDLEPERALLMESNFEALHGVDFRKGCYVGQEITARMKHRGLTKKRLYRVSAGAPLPPPGTIVEQDGKEAGELRSSLDGTGLALLRIEAVESGAALSAGGVTLSVVQGE